MRSLRHLVHAALLALLFCGIAQAAVPNAPLNFTATLLQDPATGTRVHMTWTNDASGAVPLYFAVMQASGAVQDITRFSKIQKVYAIPDSNGGVYPDYEYDVSGLKAGTYTFCVTAVNSSGVSAPSTMVVLTITGGNSGIRWTTTPPATGQIGVEYVYDADAVGGPTNQLFYAGVIMPQGATIDSLSGVLRYTTNTAGKVTFKIMARLMNDPTVYVYQSWHVQFGHDSTITPNHCAVITGSVVDQSNAPVEGAVFLLNISNPGGAGLTGQISRGFFSVPVPDSADYLIKVTGSTFATEWYQDAATQNAALPVHVRCGDSLHLSITVQAAATKTITGVVLDAVDQSPIAGAKVKAESSTGHYAYAVTNAHGEYTLTLQEGGQYILQAVDYSGAHEAMYYDNAADKSAATTITLTGNVTGVNFLLPRVRSYNNGISGMVKDSAGAGVHAKVAIYSVTNSNPTNTVVKVAWTLTDSLGTGTFQFHNLKPGEYVIYAWPGSRELVPGYYKAGDFAVDDWLSATRVTVDSQGVVSGLTVTLRKRWGITGGGIVRGTIRAKVGGILPGGATPLPEATVIIYDPSGKVSDYAVTDDNGNYEMREVPTGSLIFRVDKPGYQAYTSTMVMPGGSNPVDKSVEVQPFVVTAVDEPLAAAAIQFTLAPNPATNAVTARFLAPAASDGTVSLYNLLGVRVHHASIAEGATSVALDVHALPTGVYLAVSSTASQTSSVLLRIVR
ncbi:MAG: carboxypeptidase regulatory-like domain-containing protein [Ignavibacteria bacterium]|nr:carboxypeptidase regulatory-like domain-containing protein [Ignavibacteria bacterium]